MHLGNNTGHSKNETVFLNSEDSLILECKKENVHQMKKGIKHDENSTAHL